MNAPRTPAITRLMRSKLWNIRIRMAVKRAEFGDGNVALRIGDNVLTGRIMRGRVSDWRGGEERAGAQHGTPEKRGGVITETPKKKK